MFAKIYPMFSVRGFSKEKIPKNDLEKNLEKISEKNLEKIFEISFLYDHVGNRENFWNFWFS